MGKSSSICPGFRFYPTDEELVMYYLKRKLLGKSNRIEPIAEVDIYDFSPWDLPGKSNLQDGDKMWFFFCPKSKKYSSGTRINRATEVGYWKSTGKDRPVKYKKKTVAKIKTLVFHMGRPPKGKGTNWVIHEYRMEDEDFANPDGVQDAYVLCKLFQKSGPGAKNGAQYGAPFEEEDWDDDAKSVLESLVLFGESEANTDSENPSPSDYYVMEPGPSANERRENAHDSENVMLTNTHTTSILGDNITQEKGDDGICEDLVNLSNLDHLNEDAFNLLGIDEVDEVEIPDYNLLLPDDLNGVFGPL